MEAAGWQVAGGAAPLPVGAPALSLPREVAQTFLWRPRGPPLPLATASADPGLPSLLSVLQPGLSLPSPQGHRGAGPDVGPFLPSLGTSPSSFCR